MSFWECDKCGGIPGVTYCCTDRKEKPRPTDERADFEAWARDRYPSIDLTRHGDDYAKALAKEYWALWQSARRAQGAPQGWKLVPAEATEEWLINLRERGVRIGSFESLLTDVLAAAPQPQEPA